MTATIDMLVAAVGFAKQLVFRRWLKL